MSEKPIQDAVRAYALSQVGAAYVMGATAQKCTPAMRKSLANGRSAEYADSIKATCPVLSGKQSSCDGCKYDGRLAFDCAQLSKYAAKAGGIELPSGSNSQWTKVAWGKRGEIAGMPMDVVCCVYHEKAGRMSHVGVYLGDGMVADARGHAYGVKHQPVTDYPWTHYAIPVEIVTEEGLDTDIHPVYGEKYRPTLRNGSKGEDVKRLQELLNAAGCTPQIDEDGIFGSATQARVEAFQAAHGLSVDGIVGPLTWAALKDNDDTKDGQDMVEAPSDEPSASPAMTIEQRLARLELAVFGQGGGDPNG